MKIVGSRPLLQEQTLHDLKNPDDLKNVGSLWKTYRRLDDNHKSRLPDESLRFLLGALYFQEVNENRPNTESLIKTFKAEIIDAQERLLNVNQLEMLPPEEFDRISLEMEQNDKRFWGWGTWSGLTNPGGKKRQLVILINQCVQFYKFKTIKSETIEN